MEQTAPAYDEREDSSFVTFGRLSTSRLKEFIDFCHDEEATTSNLLCLFMHPQLFLMPVA